MAAVIAFDGPAAAAGDTGRCTMREGSASASKGGVAPPAAVGSARGAGAEAGTAAGVAAVTVPSADPVATESAVASRPGGTAEGAPA